MGRTSEYKVLFGFRNKAIFSTYEKAIEAMRWIDGDIEIVEFK